MQDDLRAFGVDEGQIAEAAARRAEQRFVVWPENRPALELFLACRTAWRRQILVGPSGKTLDVWDGLDWSQVESLARILDLPLDRRLLADLRDMEGAAMEVLNNRR
ncbi:Phage related hypothetical protein [Tistlia consotensis]|uniref:Uncharacterized protein n=1 Tax=Tistlia consotensis USBA 355 TaxID=560819 RepID=A0A1Y6CQB9_9PROT|nr:DUF1799 domain-containing protein [Tistlia consotensis]SMF83085.1 Phage related hypothetical protein [Tistlia consotensis USBA 355]SNS32024.1 Phage related hypothetical protein [Tistlia consotensis]